MILRWHARILAAVFKLKVQGRILNHPYLQANYLFCKVRPYLS
ncbi:hypothetical protein AVDCRST_MAG92-4137 [uncultured Coleofasciculus sp.]|uniref:Uncharacterized protein n=1 Tax=uncultured Coleofasciculus sp. TaxID=1267456 RepID=A0A6J4JVJ9_9CYAN|nr:hypothetical protein AVDCRST_MAG92-4137 [uncultured Coleofasciculus sp.]